MGFNAQSLLGVGEAAAERVGGVSRAGLDYTDAAPTRT